MSSRKVCISVTIYSAHRSRGKVQVLATYDGPDGVVSTTVTSVDTMALARPIVAALNQVSATATRPFGIHELDARVRSYPSGHLDALVDKTARDALLSGPATNLWYEELKRLLHDALEELDNALVAAPAPVALAIRAELKQEHEQLAAEIKDYTEGIPNENRQRFWESEFPFIMHNGGRPELTDSARDQFNRVDRSWTQAQVRSAAEDLRLLHQVAATSTAEANVDAADLTIFFEPYYDDEDPDVRSYYLGIRAPEPNEEDVTWRIGVSEWITTERDEHGSSASGEPILTCDVTSRPTAGDLTALLNAAAEHERRLADWSLTPVGQALANTSFVVTARP